ncbi:hypothetical protein I7I50_09064 [Histoplasma capsulatum G186AR]|uniref:Uncharacterized protein n=1 Tax=Ajellomyces capsulatus TaxID=5037 RepID=A0A8H8D161_AJECA|nr:hypothetical protein I7I52_06583 [Histoplasma capsulatum]QSS74054.1 hypothetical protein I7I50_09064 [Histoplasma capsulatum G186AR]
MLDIRIFLDLTSSNKPNIRTHRVHRSICVIDFSIRPIYQQKIHWVKETFPLPLPRAVKRKGKKRSKNIP